MAMFEKPESTCPLCGGLSIRKRYDIRRCSPSFQVYVCDSCGFMFMNPRLSADAVRDLYREDYYSGIADYSYIDERDFDSYFRHVWDSRVRVIRRYAPKGNFLDVGSSFGGFLRSASKYYEPYGIEISGYSGGHARSYFGSSIHIGTLEDHPFPHDHFAVITMVELIEHLADPIAAIGESHALLRKNGLLVIQTANMDGLQAKLQEDRYPYFMPGHLSYFTMKNLCMALAGCGFSSIEVYYPVEFGLLPKLMKSRATFRSPLDYLRWLRIAAYHYAGKIHAGNFAVTSSMVVYAIK
ncbi:MAG: methyltransferase domain-containing protein [Spirochaetes bacterium]|nr:methyltransferase domain-containing protein [Spirochaetota bacterium]